MESSIMRIVDGNANSANSLLDSVNLSNYTCRFFSD